MPTTQSPMGYRQKRGRAFVLGLRTAQYPARCCARVLRTAISPASMTGLLSTAGAAGAARLAGGSSASPARRWGIHLPRNLRPCVLACFLLGSLIGCGYTVVGSPDGATPKMGTLSISPFGNQAREPDLERIMTAALRQTLLRSQVLRSATADAASHQLQGTIRRFRTIALSFDDKDNVLQYRLEVDIHVRLVETLAQSPMLEQEISAATEYLVSQVAANKVREDVVARQAALARLAQQFADKCLALLTIVLL